MEWPLSVAKEARHMNKATINADVLALLAETARERASLLLKYADFEWFDVFAGLSTVSAGLLAEELIEAARLAESAVEKVNDEL